MVREDTVQHGGEGLATALAYKEVPSIKGTVRKQRGYGMTPAACPLETHSLYPSGSQVMEAAYLRYA